MRRGGLQLLQVAVFAGLFSSGEARGDELLRIRVLTYNVWGIPWITPSQHERLELVAPAVASFGPDLVALQEVWVGEDAAELEAALKRAGLIHVERFGVDWPGNSGLMIASVYPIRDVAFKAYTLGTQLLRPWHLDWIAAKGLARVSVETPLGPVEFAGTHLQAQYESDIYLPIQISQMIEASDLLRTTIDRPPLILAGDLNAAWFELPMRLLRARGAFIPAGPDQGEDSVLFRSGTGVAIRTIGLRRVLEDPFVLEDGTALPLSDHPAILAELELSKSNACEVQHDEHDEDVAREALASVDSDLELWGTMSMVMRGAIAFVLGALLATLRFRRRRAVWVLRGVLVLLVVCFAHVGLSYGPAQLRGLASARAELSADLSRLGPAPAQD